MEHVNAKRTMLFVISACLIGMVMGSAVTLAVLNVTRAIPSSGLVIAVNVRVFSAVNESVWERLKLAYWPALAYTVVEHRRLKTVSSFLTAKTVGTYLMPLIIVSSFYAYDVFIEENLLLNILIFIAAAVIGQLASCRLMTREPNGLRENQPDRPGLRSHCFHLLPA